MPESVEVKLGLLESQVGDIRNDVQTHSSELKAVWKTIAQNQQSILESQAAIRSQLELLTQRIIADVRDLPELHLAVYGTHVSPGLVENVRQVRRQLRAAWVFISGLALVAASEFLKKSLD